LCFNDEEEVAAAAFFSAFASAFSFVVDVLEDVVLVDLLVGL